MEILDRATDALQMSKSHYMITPGLRLTILNTESKSKSSDCKGIFQRKMKKKWCLPRNVAHE
jgi:outer membrane receptor for Fe3+-dicitrate